MKYNGKFFNFWPLSENLGLVPDQDPDLPKSLDTHPG
jgi:hypothetical protein